MNAHADSGPMPAQEAQADETPSQRISQQLLERTEACIKRITDEKLDQADLKELAGLINTLHANALKAHEHGPDKDLFSFADLIERAHTHADI